MADATRGRPRAAAPRNAMLFASVPPLVKTTERGDAPTRRATASRAASTLALAARPGPCTDDGFPPASRAEATARATSGRTGAVAL